jgi:serine O-acetyltransferase
MKKLSFYLIHLQQSKCIKQLFKKIKGVELVLQDVHHYFELRGCDSKKTSDFDRFKHLMKYYPEFVYIFQWRTKLLSKRLKRLFSYPNYQCKIFGNTQIEGGLSCFHPFATVINAKMIGKNFEFRNGLTIGNKNNDNSLLPSIGNNVTVGANVCIIGKINIGHNVVIGAGSVVVKNVPDNVIVAGNPAKVIRKITE